MKRESNFPPLPPFERALKYLSLRSRSVKEVYDYLVKKGYEETEINEALKRLLELKFLDDKEFTNYYVKSRQQRGKSKRLISFELSKKGISKEKAEKTLEEAEDDLKTALKYLEKRLHQFDRLDEEKRKRRIISRLTSRGFNWNIISKVLKLVSK